ncbi:hypothetical protein PG997_013190 [Apiospora hydei]|uniref:Uncharacterized protein n=1 Tax=Apiospora hydei TaxID=1337664 RepID=A0ABR1V5I4_9PEZI
MRTFLTIVLALHAVLVLASPTAPLAPGHPAAQAATGSTTTREENGAATAANDFLALVEGWQHRRASGYYVLADACGDVITEYHEPRHVKLGGCDVTQCAEELRDDESDTWRGRTRRTASSSKWCTSRSAIRPADPVTSLMGHLSYHREHITRPGGLPDVSACGNE